MHIHILGICGTFMGGIALLARALGHEVSGSDANVYPPMSTQLEAEGIELMHGYRAEHLKPVPDYVVVGNAMSRGNPAIEHMLNAGLRYISGPQWLFEHVLHQCWVLAVSGTHGKTTTASMLAWLLEDAGLAPGFLIGGMPGNFGVSARLGNMPFFVVEADEYDTAFFDKRSKFVHFHPRTLIMNNLEYDHADIFSSLEMIQRQFHHLVRMVPNSGLLVVPGQDQALEVVLDMGCWTEVETFAVQGEADWIADLREPDGSCFDVLSRSRLLGRVEWNLNGKHNVANALAALAAARHAGVPVEQSTDSLRRFRNAKRRMELIGSVHGITLYDDFAHHPTAIAATLEGMQASDVGGRVIVILEPRSNTMKMGVHMDHLANSLAVADLVFVYKSSDLQWDPASVLFALGNRALTFDSVKSIIEHVSNQVRAGDRVVIMSNGGFEDIRRRLWAKLSSAVL